jgi:hypothetical protein
VHAFGSALSSSASARLSPSRPLPLHLSRGVSSTPTQDAQLTCVQMPASSVAGSLRCPNTADNEGALKVATSRRTVEKGGHASLTCSLTTPHASGATHRQRRRSEPLYRRQLRARRAERPPCGGAKAELTSSIQRIVHASDIQRPDAESFRRCPVERDFPRTWCARPARCSKRVDYSHRLALLRSER